MKTIWFIRHGSTAGNLEKRYIGRTDEPLCQQGIAQLQHCDFQPDLLFTSPMLRTRQTAEILFPGVPARQAEDFRETDFGIFEGKTYAELSGCPAYQAWLDSGCQGSIPEGEGVAEFKERCCKAFRVVIEEIPEGKTAAFVVHGGTIMAILEAFAEPKRGFYDYHIPNGGCICCTWEEHVLHIET